MKTLILVLFALFLLPSLSHSQNTDNLKNDKQGKNLCASKNHVNVKLEKSVDNAGNKKVFATKTSVVIPADFPKYKDTGNPKKDRADYHDAKQKWIRKNPVEFEKIKHLHL
ncbi:MAG: hypothetical protein A2275_14470 [Bacteroidetes bacterium RIFOXYA12_FULL_35_11]|nr:MAG: hypothetical protein A2X01_08735 [Bacteroidetes bacterium GWF2_35_48]OFY74730.1 MAG: hypothetical protein A2275_14470 [Bacteroidetes bacterium RIFOXYA12_FULL_35_11]OFZ02460.1 MAG: hypothetical protein A2491_11205 [Bacteroidetes bacterium RIFOXYC12_FULL_35_7]HBX52494.1 hypothetical protein [Bacteroidales bacterium]